MITLAKGLTGLQVTLASVGRHISISSKPSDPRMTPQPSKTGTQPVTLQNPAARSLPRSFIYCTEGKDTMLMEPAVKQAAETAKSDAGWSFFVIC